MKHIESWNVEPGAVVKSLLNPSAKKPTTSWEKYANALSLLSVLTHLIQFLHAGRLNDFVLWCALLSRLQACRSMHSALFADVKGNLDCSP